MSAQQKAHLDRKDGEEMAAKDAEQQDTARKAREAKVKKRQDHIDEVDDWLEDIDNLLEEQEVLVSYRQLGGQ